MSPLIGYCATAFAWGVAVTILTSYRKWNFEIAAMAIVSGSLIAAGIAWAVIRLIH